MARFDWSRIPELLNAFDDVLEDLYDAIEAEPDSVHCGITSLVLDMPLHPDVADDMGERDRLIFQCVFRLLKAGNALRSSANAADTLTALDKLEHRGFWSVPDPKA